MVQTAISLGDHTHLHVFHGENFYWCEMCEEILDTYVRPHAATIGNDFILMDDNARPHRALLVEDHLESQNLERMEWSAQSPGFNLIEYA